MCDRGRYGYTGSVSRCPDAGLNETGRVSWKHVKICLLRSLISGRCYRKHGCQRQDHLRQSGCASLQRGAQAVVLGCVDVL
jgi:hypothetical protein